MEPLDYLAVLRRRWILIVAIAILGTVCGFAYASSLPTLYRSTTSVFVASQRGATTSELVQGSTFVQDQVQSYAQLAATPTVLDRVIDDLGLDTTSRALAASVAADIRLNSVIIDISVSDDDPVEAARLADSVSDSLATTIQELAPKDANNDSSIAVEQISPASVARAPFSPNTQLIVASGLGAGLIGAVLYSLGREILDTRLRSSKDLKKTTPYPVLGSIARRKTTRRQPDSIVMLTDPNGSNAEDYRRVATNIEFADVDTPVRAIVVSSALPGEGKTTSSINIALAMAERFERVLLIDCDLRKPSVGRYTGLDDSVGLTSVLVGAASFEDAVRPWANGVVDVLPSGLVPANPSQLIGSDTMARFVDSLFAEYDFIVVDSPPLLPVTDGLTLAKITDGAVIVGRAGSTRRHQLDDAIKALEVVSARVLGLVLNGTEPNSSEAYRYESRLPDSDLTPANVPDRGRAEIRENAGASTDEGDRPEGDREFSEIGVSTAPEDLTDAPADTSDEEPLREESGQPIEVPRDERPAASDTERALASREAEGSEAPRPAPVSDPRKSTPRLRAPSSLARVPRTPGRKPGGAPSRSSG